ncbi:hypothetical protein ACFQZT_14685 [Paenibacillus sp. GCM10027628]|uniref:hypothetical protein n=1 Tax=Paenibacillus sp. GCM10027628 TaxID=3273413 RepID=UPI003632EBCE
MDINMYALEKMMEQSKMNIQQSVPTEWNLEKVNKENETSWLSKLQPRFMNRIGLVR